MDENEMSKIGGKNYSEIEKKLYLETISAYQLCEDAKKIGIDPSKNVEIKIAKDLASRVESLVGPDGVAEKIKKYEQESRTKAAFQVAKELVDEFIESKRENNERPNDSEIEKAIEQALRTGTAILTEGILVAPTEGISKVEIRKNFDGTKFLAVSYAGPIRAAGGTSVALSALLADFLRRIFGIGEYRITESQKARCIEEINIYHARVARLQYKPTEEELDIILSNLPIMVDGEPTEEMEVDVHRNVPGISTNRIRGGMCLVICEGIAQKAAKVHALSKKLGIDWNWLEKIVKIPKEKSEEKEEEKKEKSEKYLEEVIAGRPIFAHPSAFGGFRLRYGRSRLTGIAAKGMHPIAMALLEFTAIGTQLKIERPGKGCIVTPCDSLEKPIVKLKNGDVIVLESIDQMIKIKDAIQKILFIGDMLITYGDFLKSNHPLLPAGYCEEWWEQELRMELESKKEKIEEIKKILKNHEKEIVEEIKNTCENDSELAFKISRLLGIPLHPKWTFFWDNLNLNEIKALFNWLKAHESKYEIDVSKINIKLKEISIYYDEEKKSFLEKALIPHEVKDKKIILKDNYAIAVLESLGLYKKEDIAKKEKILNELNDKSGTEIITLLSEVHVKDKAGTWIGCRMGRPEKVSERLMKPAPHTLFPIENFGGKTRNIMKAYRKLKQDKDKSIIVEIARRKCKNCGNITFSRICEVCGNFTTIEYTCQKCGKKYSKKIERCDCGGKISGFDKREINLQLYIERAQTKLNYTTDEIKGVIGLTSENKDPECIEKGFLRAKNGIHVFKDGTVRIDGTNAPMTHFYPKEIGTSVEKLKELGYLYDAFGKPLESDEQLVELHPQDMIISEKAADHLLNVAHFVDDELELIYKKERFYKANERKDLIGHLIIHLSPHTSCGVVSRIIGFTKARVFYTHPYNVAATRRNCDGDANSIMLLLDAFLNFSKSYLPSSRGGTMDAPIILMTNINVEEVDDEVHAMEVVSNYPIEFYEATLKRVPPSEIEIEKVVERIKNKSEKEGILFTHSTSNINAGITVTKYVTLKSMKDKINTQLALAEKLAAVDERDAAERVILGHFLPDLYGNLRSFARQQFRCIDCNAKYRRITLNGKCKCGGNLVLTISRGGIEKYLKISQEICEKYNLPNYLRQRLQLIEKDIRSIFEDETNRQFNLAEFI